MNGSRTGISGPDQQKAEEGIKAEAGGGDRGKRRLRQRLGRIFQAKAAWGRPLLKINLECVGGSRSGPEVYRRDLPKEESDRVAATKEGI